MEENHRQHGDGAQSVNIGTVFQVWFSRRHKKDQTSRCCRIAASMNDTNKGCGANGLDFSSG